MSGVIDEEDITWAVTLVHKPDNCGKANVWDEGNSKNYVI